MVDRWVLSREPEEIARLVRILASSVNVDILRELARARRKGDGWMYLSEIAAALEQNPGTISIAIAKLTPLVEEKREKGQRYFRALVTDLRIEVERPSPARKPPIP